MAPEAKPVSCRRDWIGSQVREGIRGCCTRESRPAAPTLRGGSGRFCTAQREGLAGNRRPASSCRVNAGAPGRGALRGLSCDSSPSGAPPSKDSAWEKGLGGGGQLGWGGEGRAGRNQGQPCWQWRPPVPCDWGWTLQHAPAADVRDGLECGFRHVRGRFLPAAGKRTRFTSGAFCPGEDALEFGAARAGGWVQQAAWKKGEGWPRRFQTVPDPGLTWGGPPKSRQTRRRQESRRMGVGTEGYPGAGVSVQR